MKYLLHGVLLTGLLWGLVLLYVPPIDAAGDAAKGKAVYEKYCMACHGSLGKGDGPAGLMLKPPAADFTSATSKKKSEADLKAVIENGKPGTAMGPWKGQLSPDEMSDVVGYVMILRK
jgi:mono/diheme cytochrome c family protein